MAGSPPTDVQRRWVAVLAVGPDAVLSFESAARLHHLSGVAASGPTVVTVPHSGWQRLPDVVVHQISDVACDHVTVVDGFSCTTVPRTIVDLAAIWPLGRLRIVVENAVTARSVTEGDVGTCLRSVARRGKPGVRRLATVLDDRAPGEPPPASVLERSFVVLIGRSSLDQPRRQYPLPRTDGVRGLVDFAWPEVRLIVEVDGRRWHQRIADMKRDRDRDLQAAARGWQVLRLLFEHVEHAPEETMRELVAAFRARAALFGGAA